MKENREGTEEARSWPREFLGMAESLGKIEGESGIILVVGRSCKSGRKQLEQAATTRGSHGSSCVSFQQARVRQGSSKWRRSCKGGPVRLLARLKAARVGRATSGHSCELPCAAMAARARASSKLEQGGSGQTALARVAAIGRWSGEVAVRSVRARGLAEEARAAIAATGCSKAATSRGQRWTRGAASGGAATAEVVREGGVADGGPSGG